MILRILKAVVPILVLGVGAYGAWRMVESRPAVETTSQERLVPTVRAIAAKPRQIRLTVNSQGTVSPRTVTDLIPEISGKAVFVSPSLAAGGFFEKDEVLLKIDSHDYQLALIRAEAEVAQAQVRLDQEKAEAAVAASEWQELGNGESPSPLALRKPQLAQAEAALEAARATMGQARRDLERTEIRAPFAGRVRKENVDIGQYVSRGNSVAQLYSVDVAEVRLPLPDEDLAFVNIPLSYRGQDPTEASGPSVLLKADWAGREHVWKGRIVRTEGEIDASTRMLIAVAQVTDPYGHGDDPGRPPLAAGMFVEAEILGNWLNDAVVLPRAAIRGSGTVYVIDSEGKLRFRDVDVFKREEERVIVRSGLEPGELVCISPVEAVVDGMDVKSVTEETDL